MTSKGGSQYQAMLGTGRWFQGLSPGFQADLLAAAQVRSWGSGKVLFHRGDAPDGLYACVEGSVRIVGTTEAGQEALLALVEPPTWFGEISVFDGEPRTHDAIAESAATLLRVPQEALESILAAEPGRWRELGLLMGSKLRLMFNFVEELALFPIGVRLARRLLLMAGAYGEWQDRSRRTVEIRQEQLAMMLGSSRQTINGLLKEYAAQGLLKVAYGQIELLDAEGLRRVAGLD